MVTRRATKLLARFDQVVAVNPGFIVVGLLLANEGLRCCTNNPSECAMCHQKIFDHYNGTLPACSNCWPKCGPWGALPIIASCYPNSEYTEVKYGFIRRMNLLTQTWAVPQVNFLGTIDGGSHKANIGGWTPGR